jgi:hypothetical protein
MFWQRLWLIMRTWLLKGILSSFVWCWASFDDGENMFVYAIPNWLRIIHVNRKFRAGIGELESQLFGRSDGIRVWLCFGLGYILHEIFNSSDYLIVNLGFCVTRHSWHWKIMLSTQAEPFELLKIQSSRVFWANLLYFVQW